MSKKAGQDIIPDNVLEVDSVWYIDNDLEDIENSDNVGSVKHSITHAAFQLTQKKYPNRTLGLNLVQKSEPARIVLCCFSHRLSPEFCNSCRVVITAR
jgi:hypothetical protein